MRPPQMCKKAMGIRNDVCFFAAGGVEEESTIFLSAELSDSAWAAASGFVAANFLTVEARGRFKG